MSVPQILNLNLTRRIFLQRERHSFLSKTKWQFRRRHFSVIVIINHHFGIDDHARIKLLRGLGHCNTARPPPHQKVALLLALCNLYLPVPHETHDKKQVQGCKKIINRKRSQTMTVRYVLLGMKMSISS